MKCPVCSHVSDKALLKCSSCDSVFDNQGLEEFHHATYLLAWLDEQVHIIDPALLARLRRNADSRLEQLRKELRLDELVASAALISDTVEPATIADRQEVRRPVGEIAAELSLVRSVINRWTDWDIDPSRSWPQFASLTSYMMDRAEKLTRDLETRNWNKDPKDKAKPTNLEAFDFAIRTIPTWVESSEVSPSSATALKRNLESRSAAIRLSRRTPTPAVRPAALVKRQKVTKPKEPPKPKEPLFEWAKIRQGVIDAAASGALLRGLLYLGAFMIVVSIYVLVINFWEVIPIALQLGFIAAVPAPFYLFGWLVRSKLKLPQAGSVLTGIGMLLVAVDLTAVFRFGGLAEYVDSYLYWFGASLFCTVLYAVTTWRVPLETFGYVTLLAMTSTLVSFGYLLRFEVGFIIAMIPLSSVIILGVSHALSKVPEDWAPLARAAQRLPSVLIPVSQVAVNFAPGGFGWSQALTYALAATGYGLLALLFPMSRVFRGVFSHAATWSSAAAVGFALIGAELPLIWAATATAVIAPIYLIGGRLLELREIFEETILRIYLWALYATGFGLLSIATMGGFLTLASDIWAGVVAVTIVSFLLAGCAYLFRQHLFLLGASGLFVLPYSVAIVEWLQRGEVSHLVAWLMVGWAGLALAYITVAAIMRKADRYAFWLYVLAHALAPLTVLGLFSDYAFGPGQWFAVPAVIALGLVLLLYLASALMLDSGRHPALIYMAKWLPVPFNRSVFLWPLAFVAPLWIGVAWMGSILEMAWLGVILSSLALAYIAVGQVVIQRDFTYRQPFHVTAYILPVIGIAIALLDSWALLTTLLLSVAVLISLSIVYRRVWEAAGPHCPWISPRRCA